MNLSRLLIFSTSLSLLLFSCEKEQGCTDITACNFSATAEEDDGTCYSSGDDCDDNNPNTINDTYNNSCECLGEDPPPPNYGCTDEAACNYNPEADTNDNSCSFVGDACDDFNSSTINDTYNSNCECVGTVSISGCTENAACNYNANATTNDGSCVYPGDPCNDFNSNTINDTYNSNCDCVGTTSVSGCTDSSACNYNSNATTNDGSCIYPGDSCDDGNSNTINDTYNSNCECVGEISNSNGCATNADGMVDVEFGIFTDNWPQENTLIIYDSGGNQLTNAVTPATQNAYNSWNCGFCGTNGDQLTLMVTDSYGDGIVNGAYFLARCSTENGQEVTLIPQTTWATGNPKTPNTPISTSVDFTIP